MHSRIAACFGFLAVAGASFAQTPGEQWVKVGYQGLRAQSYIWARMSGSDTLSDPNNQRMLTVTRFITDTFWSSTFDANGLPQIKLDCVEYKDGVFSRRITGDGTNLWNFHPIRNEYSVTGYNSSVVNGQRPNPLKDLLNGFNTHAQGQTAFVARLLKEVYSGGFVQYRPWLIGAQETIVSGTDSMNDPILGAARRYQATPDRTFVVFNTANSVFRSLAFQIDTDQNTNVRSVTNVFYADSSAVGGKSRMVEWQMTIQPVAQNAGNYVFVPPSNAKPIVRPGGNP